MPWKTEKRDGKWVIVRSDTGKVVGHSDSKEKAQASVRARYANTPESEIHKYLKKSK